MNKNLVSQSNSKTMGPKYEAVKELILGRISDGEYTPGDKVPSENTLVSELNVSRMTVNRALRELTMEGVLVRVAGVGSFVSKQTKRSSLIEVNDIAEEIYARGHRHTSTVELFQQEAAKAEVSAALGVKPGEKIFHSIITNYENDVPIQVEERFVLAIFAPDYLDQDFTKTTTFQYLSSRGPITEVEHIIEPILPNKLVSKLLKIKQSEPCLLLTRRTWTGKVNVTYSHFYHSRNSYKLGSRYHLNNRPK